MIKTNTYELKTDLLNYLEYYITSKEEKELEEIMIDIIEKNESKTFEDCVIMPHINNFEVSKETAALIIINILYEFDEIDASEISEKLIEIFNFQFSDAFAILDLEDYKINYKNLQKNESFSEDWDIVVLYKLDANTNFSNMCVCDDCVNCDKIVDNDLFIECCEDDLKETLYHDFNDEFNLRRWEQQIKKIYGNSNQLIRGC